MQFFSNLSRNGIASQVAEKIAQCNRAFTGKLFNFFFNFEMFNYCTVHVYTVFPVLSPLEDFFSAFGLGPIKRGRGGAFWAGVFRN